MRRSLVALSGLLAGLLGLAIPQTAAQEETQFPPVAIAVVTAVTSDQQAGRTTVALDGSRSFDPNGSIAKYEWEVVTEAYANIPVAHSRADADNEIPAGRTATFVLLDRTLADRGVHSVEFRLTVTDDGRPAASSSTTVVANINHGPTAEITVTAKLPAPRSQQLAGFDDNGNGVVDENEERYTVEGVIARPGENDNLDYEWDIREGTLLVVDGSASSDPDGPLPASAFSWTRLYHSDVASVTASLPGDTDGVRSLSTDEDPDVVGSTTSETVGRLPFVRGNIADPYYLYYQLTVTDGHGATSTAVVKIVVRDAHDNPTVEILHPESDPDASTAADRREGIQPAGENRYLISPETAEDPVTLTAVGTGDGSARTRLLEHTWSGPALEPDEDNQPGSRTTAVFTAPEGFKEGDSFVISVEVVDSSEFSGSTSVELVIAENLAPIALAPDDIDTPDGTNGGFPVSDPPSGRVELDGLGFDPDNDDMTFRWEQVRNSAGDELLATYRGPRLSLAGADTDAASFPLPEVTTGTRYVVYVQFTATDSWGVSDSDVVRITIHDGDDDLRAIAGVGQRVSSGSFVRLRGRINSGLISDAAIASVSYEWAYVGIETLPRTEHRPAITEAEADEGFTAGEWFPNDDGSYSPTAGGRLKTVSGRYPYFDAPRLHGFNSVKLIFTLTVGGVTGQQDHTDTVAVTVVGGYFSGVIDGPDYCANRSLGGPVTYPVDSDKDGVADICALDTTRRAAIARQNALERLAAINPDDFEAALHGPPDDPDTDADESDRTKGTCYSAPKDLPGDTAAALEADSCGPKGVRDRRVSSPPAPIDPAKAGLFFSGPVITGPAFCTNLGLGGQPLYALDRDGDGIADTCSLAYTRREAVARHNALEAAFADHPQFPAALAAACTALGTLDFGDSPAALAADRCSRPTTPQPGQPLPTAPN